MARREALAVGFNKVEHKRRHAERKKCISAEMQNSLRFLEYQDAASVTSSFAFSSPCDKSAQDVWPTYSVVWTALYSRTVSDLPFFGA